MQTALFPLPCFPPSPVHTANQAPACNCGTEQAPSAYAWVVPDGPGSSAPRQQMIARRNESPRQKLFYTVSLDRTGLLCAQYYKTRWEQSTRRTSPHPSCRLCFARCFTWNQHAEGQPNGVLQTPEGQSTQHGCNHTAQCVIQYFRASSRIALTVQCEDRRGLGLR